MLKGLLLYFARKIRTLRQTVQDQGPKARHEPLPLAQLAPTVFLAAPDFVRLSWFVGKPALLRI
jgi:hypothetical protein